MGVPRVGIVFGKGWVDGLVLPEPRKPVMIGIVSKRADVNATLHKIILRMLSSQEKAACVRKPNR
jgi:hypothetical protein